MNIRNSTLRRRKALTSKTPLRRFSLKRIKKEYQLRKLINFLKHHRADGKCELCLNDKGLQGAHIDNKGNGGPDTAGNIIIACPKCHRHDAFKKGLPIPAVDALVLVQKRNAYFNISNDLTGADLPLNTNKLPDSERKFRLDAPSPNLAEYTPNEYPSIDNP